MRIIMKASFGAIAVSCVCIVATLVLGVTDVVGAKLLSAPLLGAKELTANLVAIAVFGGLAFVQVKRGHIRITMLTDRLSGKVIGRLVDAFGLLIVALVMGLSCWRGCIYLRELIVRGTYQGGTLTIPLWPFILPCIIALFLFLLAVVFDLYSRLRRRDL